MKYITKWCLACVSACSMCWAKAGDTKLADSLFAAGNFQRAALEYERAFFSDTSYPSCTVTLLKRAYCFKAQKDFSASYTTLSRITLNHPGDSLDYTVRMEKALCAYLASDYDNAAYELQQLDFFIHDTLLLSQSLFLKVLVYSELEKWEDTRIALKKYFLTKHINADILNMDVLISLGGLRSEKKAKLLSCFFPGSGQAYAGYPGRALSALLLQGAAGAFAIYSIMHGYYAEGIFTGGGMFLRFYTGGVRYSGLLAQRRNSEKNNAAKQKIKFMILQYESGK